MSSEPIHSDAAGPAPASDARREIDQVVEELVALSESTEAAGDLHRLALDRLVSTLAAVGGAVWTCGPDGSVNLDYQIKMEAAVGDSGSDQLGYHEQIVLSACQAEDPLLIPPQSGAPSNGGLSNPSDLLLVVCVWRVNGDPAGAIEIFQRPGTSPGAQRGYARFMEVVCEIIEGFHRSKQLADLHGLKQKWNRFERFSENVHRSVQLKETAYHVVNEARHYLSCDRVWLAVTRGPRCRVMAVSGVDTVNRRANVVRALERLAGAVVKAGEPLWHDSNGEDRPAEIEVPLSQYIDTGHLRTVAIVPLFDPQPAKQGGRAAPLGALIAERFFEDGDDEFRSDIRAVCTHSQLALANAITLQRIPLSGLLQRLGRLRWLIEPRRLPLTLLAVLVVAGIVAALSLVQTDFEISARGQLQPVERRHVFAPDDGVVTELHVEHGANVSEGQILLKISGPQVDVEYNRVLGELQTARQRLTTIKAERLQNPRETREQRARDSQLTAEETEVGALIGSLEKQYEIVKGQQEGMEIRSPIRGRVVSWNLAQRLRARPVAHGDELLTVANLEGPWQLELQVGDRRIRHVREAQEAEGPALDVTFILAMDPRKQHAGRVANVGVRTEVDEREGPFVPVGVEIADQQDVQTPVPGATVRARIHCGRRAVGYVWFHEVWEAIQTWVVF